MRYCRLRLHATGGIGALGRTGNVFDGRHEARYCRESPSSERALDVLVVESGKGALDVVGDGREAGVGAAAVLLQLALQELLI